MNDRENPLGTANDARGDRVALAFHILELVADRRTGISANEIAQTLGIHRATAYRALNSLVSQEFLLRCPDLSGFILGVRVTELAKLIAVEQRTEEGPLDVLRRETGCAIHLARFDEDRIALVDEDPGSPIPQRDVFLTEPARSAVGQLLLTELPSARSAQLARLAYLDLAEIIEATTLRGFAQQIGLLSPDRACLAVPVRIDRTLVGALALSTAPSRISIAARHVERLRAVAGELAARWNASHDAVEHDSGV
jgi:DNA-binding IclR family transcriptional regulator